MKINDTGEPRSKLAVVKQVAVLLLYLGLALLLTYPLVLQFGDHVPGTTTWSMDEYGYVWNNWWFKHAVFDLGTSPFQTDMLFYPLGTSLVLYTFTWLHVLLGLPIQLFFGLIPASNVELLFSFVIGGYGAFLLAEYLLRRADVGLNNRHGTMIAAFAAGALFTFASNRFVYASLGHYNVVATEWIPFYILFLIKTIEEPRYSNALMAGLFVAFALYVETTDGVLIFLFTLVYLACAFRKVWDRRTITRLGVMATTATLLFGPLLIPTIREITGSGYSLPGWGHSENLLVDLFGFLTPTSLNVLNRRWVEELDLVRQTTSRFVDVNTVFVGYVTLLLAAAGLVTQRRRVLAWVVSAVTFAVLALGPLLHINGQSTFDLDGLQVTFPLPFLLLHYIPLLKENRVPNRFSVLLMLSLAMLVAYATRWLIQRARNVQPQLGIVTGVALLVLLLGEHASVPLPLTDARIPTIYEKIAQEPGDFAVLTLPLGWRNSFGQLGAEDTRVQYYQSAHAKFLFTGNIQRNPPYLFDYFDRIALFHSFAEIESYQQVSDEQIARDRADAPGLMALLNVRYLVVNASIPGRPPYSDTRSAALDYARRVLPLGDKVYDEGGVLAYRINVAPLPTTMVVPFGNDAAHPFQAEGWDRDEVILDEQANWANRTEARILVPSDGNSDYQLVIRALPFAYPGSPAQTMKVIVNGQLLADNSMQPKWQDYTLFIPRSVLRSGPNNVVLQFGYTASPRAVFAPKYGIGRAENVSPVDIVVNSGLLGSIKVNGTETSLLGRGYNVVVLDPTSGQVKARKSFNTADDRSQSRAMTDFIRALPTGAIVAVASQEDASGSLGDQTVTELAALGSKVDIRKTAGRSHALIGVKGATPGTVVEASNDGTSFVSVGRNPDERTLAAAVSWITIEKR